MKSAVRLVFFACLLLVVGGLLPLRALAHQTSESYLSFVKGNSVQISLALRDLDLALPSLDNDNDRELTRSELDQALPGIGKWLNTGLQIRCGAEALLLDWQLSSVAARGEHQHAILSAPWRCAAAQAVDLNYQLLVKLDAAHRVLISGEIHGQPLNQVLTPVVSTQLTLYAPNTPTVLFDLVVGYLVQGMHHLALGWDHLAFLLALLLPLPFLKSERFSQNIKPAVWRVSCFTVGHSLSLIACVLGWVESPAWSEPVIALSIAFAVGIQFVRWPFLRAEVLALGFGLIHGLGFSSVLVQANISAAALPWALLGFNLGIELAQLVFVVLWCVLMRYLPAQASWRGPMVQLGSVALVMGSMVWFYQALPS
jgi:hypothetical protein